MRGVPHAARIVQSETLEASAGEPGMPGMPRFFRGCGWPCRYSHVPQPGAEVSSVHDVPHVDSWFKQQQVFLHPVMESRHARSRSIIESPYEKPDDSSWLTDAVRDSCRMGTPSKRAAG